MAEPAPAIDPAQLPSIQAIPPVRHPEGSKHRGVLPLAAFLALCLVPDDASTRQARLRRHKSQATRPILTRNRQSAAPNAARSRSRKDRRVLRYQPSMQQQSATNQRREKRDCEALLALAYYTMLSFQVLLQEEADFNFRLSDWLKCRALPVGLLTTKHLPSHNIQPAGSAAVTSSMGLIIAILNGYHIKAAFYLLYGGR
ncbi:hypothetical protein EDB80DRAFT_693611 [Ilyonectria destructans]|nr:hypothetical protein EDB80DRAFT_693611 [Ilyonectria destructans]